MLHPGASLKTIIASSTTTTITIISVSIIRMVINMITIIAYCIVVHGFIHHDMVMLSIGAGSILIHIIEMISHIVIIF